MQCFGTVLVLVCLSVLQGDDDEIVWVDQGKLGISIYIAIKILRVDMKLDNGRRVNRFAIYALC